MSAAASHASESEVAILARILSNEDGELSTDFAQYIQNHKITERDKARMNELARRNQNDELTPAEKAELVGFAKATTLLSILKSQARQKIGAKPQKRISR